jgi:hypothetical protein
MTYSGFRPQVLLFFLGLRANNNREWFPVQRDETGRGQTHKRARFKRVAPLQRWLVDLLLSGE